MKVMKAAVLALVIGAVVGCQTQMPQGGSPEAWARVAAGAPVRTAVFVDCGARSNGHLRWLQLTALSPELEAFPVDAAMIRAGALENADLIVMPGGYSVKEAKTLGAEGREIVRDFIRRGGGWIGACAGCFLICQTTASHPDMLNVAPYTTWCPCGQIDMMLKFTADAEKMMGIRAGHRHRVKYSGGPVMMPVKPTELQDFRTVAVYDSNHQVFDAKPRQSMAGCAAMIAGTYGKGRVFASAVHPEVDPGDHDLIRGAFRYVTGRRVTWKLPQRQLGQLALGVVSDDSVGVESARLLQKLIRDGKFDITFVSGGDISDEGALRHLDALLVPDGAEFCRRKFVSGDNLARTKEFLARGGRIVGWGKPCRKILPELGSNTVCAADGAAAVKWLEAYAASPLPAAGTVAVKKVAKPVKVAFYTDRGGANYNVSETFEFSPEFDLEFVSAADIRAGALRGADLVVQPGGGCNSQYLNLQKEGQDALRAFVRGGGSYYGICAGAFLATQSMKNRGRLGLVPWKSDGEPVYRGWGKIGVDFTKDGLEALGLKGKDRMVLYWGGPVMVPGDPVEDTDITVFGTYAGRMMNTCQPNEILPMDGKAAFLGGRVGKGRVFVSAIHPEKQERTYDIVTGVIKYLTGREAVQVRRDRVRGALSIASESCTDRDAARFLVQKLMHDLRFDLRVDDITPSVREHADVILMLQPSAGDFGPDAAAFVANGGTVIALADTPARAAAVAKFKYPGATVVKSYGEVFAKLLALHQRTAK